VLTSVEFDHADIYRDLDHVKEAFRSLVSTMPREGRIIAAVDHEHVRAVLEMATCPVIGYGVAGNGPALWRARDLSFGPDGVNFKLMHNGRYAMSVRSPLHGRHNVENVLAAIATLEVLGVPAQQSVDALPTFAGVKRRLEVRGEVRGVTVLDDFAHHPTAVRETVAAVRAAYPERRLIAVFEPRTNTSRRAIFQRDYVEAFSGVDRVEVLEVPKGPVYSNTGEVIEYFSSERLCQDMRSRNQHAYAFGKVEAIVEDILREHKPGDIVLIMSNGAFGNIWEKLLDALRALDQPESH